MHVHDHAPHEGLDFAVHCSHDTCLHMWSLEGQITCTSRQIEMVKSTLDVWIICVNEPISILYVLFCIEVASRIFCIPVDTKALLYM